MSDTFSPPPAPASDVPSEDRTLALITHLSGIFLSFILPLILWLVNKDKPEKPFLTDQAKEALNFQITIALGWLVAIVLSFVLIGFLLYPVLAIGNLVFCILAGIKANNGEFYRYPIALRLIS